MTNQQKTPLSRTLPAFVRRKVLDQIWQLGLGLPGHVVSVAGPIVTVAFDVVGLGPLQPVEMPLASAEYVRLPIQPNDKGYALPADAFLGGISGLASGTQPQGYAPGSQPNLSTLVWLPVGSKGWSAVDNPNMLVLYGPQGVEIRDTGSHSVVKVSSTAGVSITSGLPVTITVGANTIALSSAGITLDGIPWDTHVHLYDGEPTGPPQA